MTFLAIDFETANYSKNSACAIGLVRVENNIITEKQTHLIKPPTSWFVFTDIHGITWSDVKDSPTFGELWPLIKPMFDGADFLVAHNSSFDEGVLRASCAEYGIEYPDIPFQCTVKISRKIWNIYPTKLNLVCEHFNIPLDHHNAASDTEACAQIMMLALKEMEKENSNKR
jgi:DNA polymerase III subunit epsilon